MIMYICNKPLRIKLLIAGIKNLGIPLFQMVQ